MSMVSMLTCRKEIIARENLTVMGVVGRYIAAYSKIDKMFWWDKDAACGPIVEQGTHFGNKYMTILTQSTSVAISVARPSILPSEPMLLNISKDLASCPR
jgi:hypothetical protein